MSKIAQAYKEQRATPVTFEQLVEERKQWYEMQDNLRKIITHQENMIWDLEQKNRELQKQANHLSKTQARQFVDNQKLQVKAEKAKDVVNIDTARQIKHLKELLKDLQSEAIDALTAIQKDCESDTFSIFNYPEVQTFYTLSEKIDEVLK